MKIYFISGLGADEQMFQRIVLPAGFEIVHLRWLQPCKDETFIDYARRLSQPIDTAEPFALLGLSLGGMMAIEMNKFLSPSVTILISSAVNRAALPLWFRLSGFLRLYKIVPDFFYRHAGFVSNWLLGTASEEDRKLLKKVMLNASPSFVRWAVPRILNWNNEFIPGRMYQLHGTADVILPFKKEERIIAIEDGTHFMVYNRAEEINLLLAGILAGIQ